MKDQDTTSTLKLQRFLAPASPKPSADQSDQSVSRLVAQAVAEAASPDSPQPTPAPGLPNNTILGVLTYCYATGTYGSAEIAEKLRNNAVARRATEEALPDTGILRRFRRTHRQLLQYALERALRLIRRSRIQRTVSQTLPGSTAAPIPALPRSALNSNEGTTTIFVRGEAQRKIENAAITDMALD